MASIRRKEAANPLASRDAFERLYRRHADKLTAHFVRKVFDLDIALELSAESFAEAFISRKRFRGQTDDQQAAWLYAIGRHQLNRYFRRGRVSRKLTKRLGIELVQATADDHQRMDELLSLPAIRTALTAALAEVSPSERAAIKLRIIDELPYDAVGQALGISQAAARARVSRGLRALHLSLDANPLNLGERNA